MSTNTDQEIDLANLEAIANVPHCEAMHMHTRDGVTQQTKSCTHVPVAVFTKCTGSMNVCMGFVVEVHAKLMAYPRAGHVDCHRPISQCYSITPL